jgi:hypothetical protein
MKDYNQIYEGVSSKPSDVKLASLGSSFGSIDELADRFRSFYKETHPILFDIMVKQVWLEQNFLWNGTRLSRTGNGVVIDQTYSYFLKYIVGITQKPVTTLAIFVAITKYFDDFFPNFSNHDPFKEPEYFKYPYKNVTLDFLFFVQNYHDKIKLLEEAEKRIMKVGEFIDWATSVALSYMDEKGNEVYRMACSRDFMPYLTKIEKGNDLSKIYGTK